jgi:hypothetical protein
MLRRRLLQAIVAVGFGFLLPKQVAATEQSDNTIEFKIKWQGKSYALGVYISDKDKAKNVRAYQNLDLALRQSLRKMGVTEMIDRRDRK